MEPEWRFSLPMGVTFDPKKNRFFVADTQRYRLQILINYTATLSPSLTSRGRSSVLCIAGSLSHSRGLAPSRCQWFDKLTMSGMHSSSAHQ